MAAARPSPSSRCERSRLRHERQPSRRLAVGPQAGEPGVRCAAVRAVKPRKRTPMPAPALEVSLERGAAPTVAKPAETMAARGCPAATPENAQDRGGQGHDDGSTGCGGSLTHGTSADLQVRRVSHYSTALKPPAGEVCATRMSRRAGRIARTRTTERGLRSSRRALGTMRPRTNKDGPAHAQRCARERSSRLTARGGFMSSPSFSHPTASCADRCGPSGATSASARSPDQLHGRGLFDFLIHRRSANTDRGGWSPVHPREHVELVSQGSPEEDWRTRPRRPCAPAASGRFALRRSASAIA